MNVFDFNHDHFKKNSPVRQKFYKENHNKPITVQQFVEAVTGWPKKPDHRNKTRAPGRAEKDYKQLVIKYGFFPGGQ